MLLSQLSRFGVCGVEMGMSVPVRWVDILALRFAGCILQFVSARPPHLHTLTPASTTLSHTSPP
jgi:hypothetical protein